MKAHKNLAEITINEKKNKLFLQSENFFVIRNFQIVIPNTKKVIKQITFIMTRL